jgi:hypothetical protein
MSCHDRVYAWRTEVAAHLPHLSGPQAMVLALWSFGMVLAGSCGRTAVGTVLAAGLGCAENTVRQRLREWCNDADDKRGVKRTLLANSTIEKAASRPAALRNPRSISAPVHPPCPDGIRQQCQSAGEPGARGGPPR